MDWGFGEMMAYGSLLQRGLQGAADRARTVGAARSFIVTRRCTTRRPARSYMPLDDIDNRRGSFIVTDSLLSEEAVLGFEYGYSTTDPETLVIWEAQFGDFCQRRAGRD